MKRTYRVLEVRTAPNISHRPEIVIDDLDVEVVSIEAWQNATGRHLRAIIEIPDDG